MSNGTAWVKVDNTDAVVSVNGKTGAVTITLAELEGLAADGDASNVTNAFIAAGSRANLASGETLSTSLGKLMKWYTDLSTGACIRYKCNVRANAYRNQHRAGCCNIAYKQCLVCGRLGKRRR